MTATPITIPDPDANNTWRLETPGSDGWIRSARPDADDKFFLCSADGHVQEPNSFLSDRIDAKYHDRLPGVTLVQKTNDDGSTETEQFQKTDGFRVAKLNWTKPFEGHEKLRNDSGRDPESRIRDLALDGCDAEILFPNKGLTAWATPDADFSHEMCRAWNDWAWEDLRAEYNDQPGPPMACIAPAAHRRRRSPRSSGVRRARDSRVSEPAVQAGFRSAQRRRSSTTT